MHRDVASSAAESVREEQDALPEAEDQWVFVLDETELPENSMAAVTIGEHEIALYHLSGGEICATSNICTHGMAYLTEGWLDEHGTVECPLHAGCFDVRTGARQGFPIEEDLPTYPVRRRDGQIFVKVSRGD